MKSTIYMMPSTDFKPGKCSVCKLKAFLKFKDMADGSMMGECCMRYMVHAERMMAPYGKPLVLKEGTR